MNGRVFPSGLPLLLCSLLLAAEAAGQSGTRSGRFARRRPTADSTAPSANRQLVARPVLALEGNDPVALRRDDKLVAGDANRASTFDGQLYRFASDANKATFDADPKHFAPVLAGDSIIAWTLQHRLVPGIVKQRAVHDDRLFLFASDAEKAQFDAAPTKYKDGDLLLGGVSPVALVDEEAIKRGSEQFCHLFEGRRVFLASADEKSRFRGNPGKYFPTLAGVDPVSFVEGKPLAGSADYSVVYKNRLYLLASGESRTRFIEAPQTYSDADVALNGACPVLFAESHELANGHYGFSTVCLGRRFLFQSDEHRKKFADDPTRYVLALANRYAPSGPPTPWKGYSYNRETCNLCVRTPVTHVSGPNTPPRGRERPRTVESVISATAGGGVWRRPFRPVDW